MKTALILNDTKLSSFWKISEILGMFDLYDIRYEFGKRIPAKDDRTKFEKFFQMGKSFDPKTRADKQVQHLDKCLPYAEKMFGKESKEVAQVYSHLGHLWFIKRDYKQSYDLYNKAQQMLLACFGESSVEVSEIRKKIVKFLMMKKKQLETIDILKKCLEIDKKHQGDNHLEIAKSYESIGGVQDVMGKRDLYMDMMKKAMEINTKNYGEMHECIGAFNLNIGIVMYEKRMNLEALDYMNKAFVIYTKVYGEMHNSTLDILRWIKRVKEELPSQEEQNDNNIEEVDSKNTPDNFIDNNQ